MVDTLNQPIPQGVFAELRVAKKLRDVLTVDLQKCKARFITGSIDTFQSSLPSLKAGKERQLHLLKLEALPHELVTNTEEELLIYLRQEVKRSIGLNKIKALKEAANRSIGIRQGAMMAKMELRTLIQKYELI